MTTITLIESNDRSAGILNGVRVDGIDLQLSGSDKQVEWARKIIAQHAATIAKTIASRKGLLKADGQTFAPDQYAALAAEITSAVEIVLGKVAATPNLLKASWWIDNRQYGTAPSHGEMIMRAMAHAAR